MRAAIALAALILLSGAARAQERGGRLPDGFVYLRDVEPTIRQDMRYAGPDNFTGRPLPGYGAAECLLRRPAALALKRAQADLAGQGLSLKVYDCYRPARAVAAKARWARDPSATPDTRRFFPGLSKNELFARGYISANSAHSRGIAVDLTLMRRDAPAPEPFNPSARYAPCNGPVAQRAPDDSLDMGTAFDCFDAGSHTRSAAITPAQREPRELLLNAMTRQGFKNYRREWWHFTYPAADPGIAYDVQIQRR